MPSAHSGPARVSPFLLHRRSLMRWGGVTLAASAGQLLGLHGNSAANAAANAAADQLRDRMATADQVVFLWLPGGVTHHESFDHKPEAPA